MVANLSALLCTILFLLLVVPQNAKQELNDQMWEAVRKGDAATVTALLDKGADVNAKFRYGATALFKAAERGHLEVVKVLLARGADVSVKDSFYGATAMDWALDHTHVEIVRLLLEKDPAKVNEVLMTGVRKGKPELVRIAIERGGLKPETLSAALAAADKNPELVEMLKKAGAAAPLEVEAKTLQSYVGKYRSDQGLELNITFVDGKLFVAAASQQPVSMMAVDKTTFRPTAFDGIAITFNVEAGKTTSASLKQGETTTPMKRVE